MATELDASTGAMLQELLTQMDNMLVNAKPATNNTMQYLLAMLFDG
jgi:hypothetical protein